MIRALIFDFDGLILATEEPIYESWRELYHSYGVELPLELWGSIIGRAEFVFDPRVYLDEQLGRSLDWAAIQAVRRQRETDLIAALPILPGVQDYLESARRLGLKTSIASSSPRRWVAGHLSRYGLLHYFDCLLTIEMVQNGKPAPDLYLAALDCLGVSAGEAIVFEDSPNGILAAKQAGLICVAVPTPLTSRLSLDQADLRLDSLADLPLENLIQKVHIIQSL